MTKPLAVQSDDGTLSPPRSVSKTSPHSIDKVDKSKAKEKEQKNKKIKGKKVTESPARKTRSNKITNNNITNYYQSLQDLESDSEDSEETENGSLSSHSTEIKKPHMKVRTPPEPAVTTPLPFSNDEDLQQIQNGEETKETEGIIKHILVT